MKISPNSFNIQPLPSLEKSTGTKEASGGADFTKGLENAIGMLADTQTAADEMITKAATGQIDDLNKVVIAVERANIAMQLGVQVRNKVVEAYQDIMHMQV